MFISSRLNIYSKNACYSSILLFFTRSPSVPDMPRHAQSGRRISFGIWVWFTESYIDFTICLWNYLYLRYRASSYPFKQTKTIFYVYRTVRHLDSWIKIDQLDVTCIIISLFNAQYVSNVGTSILRSLRLICCVISWVVLLWFDVCWCYGVVRLGWCGIVMQAEALVPQPA